MNCNESDLWFNAMKDELNSMVTNGVWDLVKLPNGAKNIEYKCVYKTKKDSLGNSERYKERLVAKGFTQKKGIDYKETFSPTSKKDSLCIILAVVAHFDFEVATNGCENSFLQWGTKERGIHETTRRILL